MNKYINIIAVLYALVVPISRAGIVLFSALLILLWIIEGDFKNKLNKIKNNILIKLLAIFILYYFISLFWSDDIKEAFLYAKKFWYFLVIVVIFTSVKKEYIKYMISAFLFSMLISEIISYGVYFELWHFKSATPHDPTPFMNHLQYSMFLAFTALLLLNRFFVEEKNIYRYGYFIYFLTVTMNLFINGGRTGQMAFVISIFVVGFLNIKNKIKSTLIIFSLISTILFISYTYSTNFKHRVNSMFDNIHSVIYKNNFSTSVGARIGFYLMTYEILQDNPIIGVGTSDAMKELKVYANKSSHNFEYIKRLPNYHNDFLQILVQLGIIGGILYILIFYNIFKLNINNKEYKNLPIIFVSVYIISSMFENMIHQQFSMVLFSLFVGIFLAQSKNEKKI